MKNNLFVVRTPLQCFNAIEARDRLHADDQNRLLIYYGREIDRQLIANQLDSQWQEIHWLRFRGMNKRRYGWLLAAWLRQLPPIDTMYLGLVTHLPLHVANVLQPATLRLLDDGNETLLIARGLQAAKLHPTHFRRAALDRLLGLKRDPDILQRMEAFSLYDTTAYGIPRLVNDYRAFRRRTAQLPVRAGLMFIGSNLVGTYFRDEAALLAQLGQVRQHFAGMPLWYCPHRYESDAMRRKIAALGFELFCQNAILEYAFLQAGWRPERIASFRSTAIDTLAQIYGITGCMLEVPQTAIRDEKWQEMRAVWQDYQQRGGRVIAAADYAGT